MTKKSLPELLQDKEFGEKIRQSAERYMDQVKNQNVPLVGEYYGGLDELDRQVEEMNEENERKEELQRRHDKRAFIMNLVATVSGVLALIVSIIALFRT